MCGIVGYVGPRNASPILMNGLRALEYRGYDSAGIYISGAGAMKRAGQVAMLAEALPASFEGTCGIAHTRWATHGAPTETNAHPHSDEDGEVWLVHNGIIENYADLKEKLIKSGMGFKSDTDTEVLAGLVASKYGKDVPLEEAVAAALKEVRGTYGLAVASKREPEKIVAARLASPIMLGIGKNEYYVASDATPILKHTRDVVYLDDREIAVLTPDGYRVTTLSQEPLDKEVETLEWDVESAQKKGYEHFMLKEMMEIPDALENTLRGRLVPGSGEVNLGGLRDVLPRIKRAKNIVITACGSAFYAAQAGELLIEELTGIPVETVLASELRYRRNTMDPDDTVLFAISQSGETLDTLEAIREAKRHGILCLGVVNVVGSSIARETDAGVYNHAGPEISVASTKAVVSQMAVLALVALLMGRNSGLSAPEGERLVKELSRIPELARRILESHKKIREIAARYKDTSGAFYLGRKMQYPIAYEGAIKLKEISYIHAEAYGAGEMKHGPIALIEPSFLSVVLAPEDSMYEKSKSNMQEIRARGGRIIAITTEGKEEDLRGLADDVLTVPKADELFMPILTTIPLQLFAYYVALERGLPIDKPRNLAKSVTVE